MARRDENIKVRTVWEIETRIRNHLEQVPKIEELAADCGMSVRNFHRYFEKVTGESPAAYIQRLRLARGAAWLAYSNATVIEAAVAAGYDSREAFSRYFRAMYKCPPQEFRIRLQQYVREKMTIQPPQELRVTGMQYIPEMRLLARPHFGTPLSTLSAWRELGEWCKLNNAIIPEAKAVTFIYDDAATLPQNVQERYDVAITLHNTDLPEYNNIFIQYTIPGGMYATAEYTGNAAGLEYAWDYFGLAWFLKSGLQMRESRFLMLHRPDEMPTSMLDAARLLAGKKITCQLCIPADYAPTYEVPVLKNKGR